MYTGTDSVFNMSVNNAINAQDGVEKPSGLD